jgi:hypothetical protein
LKESKGGSGLLRVDYTGLVYSFLLSVGNDSQWLPVLESSTKMCCDQLDGAGEGYTCGGLVFDCSDLKFASKNFFIL